jgi:periplasmic mercuric ion binding protein
MKVTAIAAASALLGLFVSSASAIEVVVKDVHMCCGQCVKIGDATLKDVKGVSDAKCSQEGKSCTFKAEDDKAVTAGLEALAKAGFHGKATKDGKETEFPKPDIKEGKSNEITATGVHLCCGACVTGVTKALKDVKGVKEVKADRKESTVTVTGEEIDAKELFAALTKAGFHGNMKK